ncbi:GntR family transcriptional regulator [Caldalkalibacillus mannanilyticus]|uniref:GntR family transcriptional regulator n=1 Tax=Caldalkalibacillus mannanilyticus TaxID=1418 RepID=UPI000469271B|nr:GntR family transcriptional regulator [Caldalkalibacillus mannanilyticus]
MKISIDENQPIFKQIADIIEDQIINDMYRTDEQILSTTQLTKMLQINPATVVKGINLLVKQGILYKKSGIGMFVSSGAKENILKRRRQDFYRKYVETLLEEAKKIHLTEEDILNMIKRKEG